MWAHAVNSRGYLRRTLVSEACCIEADVGWNDALQTPVMTHHARSSNKSTKDFTLTEFLKMVVGSEWLSKQGKIIKFDFKSIEAVGPCAAQVKESGLMSGGGGGVQIWLNADVARGPGAGGPSAATPLDFQLFKRACARLPAAAMSLGWTTGFDKFTPFPNELYSKAMVDEMLALTGSLPTDRHVIYALRASLVKGSWAELRRLVAESTQQQTSLSVWTGAEGVPRSELAWMRDKVAFFDVHKGSKEEWFSWGRVFALQNVGYSYAFGVAVVSVALAILVAVLFTVLRGRVIMQ